jgi:RNA polymerase sigma factor (sigma-70 family)
VLVLHQIPNELLGLSFKIVEVRKGTFAGRIHSSAFARPTARQVWFYFTTVTGCSRLAIVKRGGATKSREFHTTRWSIIAAAAERASPKNREALTELCRQYWYPIYAFARRSGYDAHDSQDLTQSFFQHLLEQNALNRATPAKGRFRTFLLASFQNHLSHFRERARAIKRGGGQQLLSLDGETAEDRYWHEPADDLTPEKIFEARWTMTVLAEAMSRLSEEYASQGKTATFEALKSFLDPINAKTPPSYEEAADGLRVSVGAVKTLIYRLRKRYTALLREEVASTVLDPADIDDELRALCDALIASEGRLDP